MSPLVNCFVISSDINGPICDVSVPIWDFDRVIAEGRSQEELDAEEQEEEEEAKNVQKRLAENLSEEDYDLNFLQVQIIPPHKQLIPFNIRFLNETLSSKEFAVEEKDEDKTVEKREKIVKDLKQMSRKEKMKLLKKESPELLELIQDFKAKVRLITPYIKPHEPFISRHHLMCG